MYLTKHHAQPTLPSETDAENKTGAPEIQVTPEMIEAGVVSYLEHCPDSGVGDHLDGEMVTEIFSVMLAAKHRAPRT